MQFILTKDSQGHRIQSVALSARQMLGQDSLLFFEPCQECDAILVARINDLDGEMVTETELQRCSRLNGII